MRRYVKQILITTVIVVFIPGIFIAEQYYELIKPGIVVLLYHKVLPDDNGSKYSIKPDKFEEQLRFLKTHGYNTILPSDVIRTGLNNNPANIIMLSFDDGTTDHYMYAYPILKRNGYRGVFFIVSKYMNSPGCLNVGQIRDMSKNNMEIGSHSYSHLNMDELSHQAVLDELVRSKNDLEKVCKTEIISFAPPGGWFIHDVVKTADQTGYKAFFSCKIGTNDLRDKPFIYNRIEVLSTMSLDDFARLLNPREVLWYKLKQTVKFAVHDIIGSKNYSRLATAIH
jgi:peptidoglycan/xylan/chitin deacetylase (PgdA/CDA1 family)